MKLFNFAAAAILALSAAAAHADEYRDPATDKPTAGAMAVDLLLVRPVSLVATVLGVGLFVLNLPLSIVQGEPPVDPAKRWIVEPARYTFDRPLGEME
ncbi:MAG TPA: hypothetical protein VLI06_10445 [Solimonas sp.]|nr:hypothetical protein [Solimonas sp.]